jgi:hypothetical protein
MDCGTAARPFQTEQEAAAFWNRRQDRFSAKERDALEWAILAFNDARDMKQYEATIKTMLQSAVVPPMGNP